jgi:hypothetical protein
MEKDKILAGDDCAEVKAELGAITGYARRVSRPKNKITEEQKMIRDLQSVFCTGRYRSWAFSQTKRY